ncbi:MAG: hypothetical protein K6U78_10765 [Anaerolineae bacterium]|nr:hypothetical protein [Anaerolineae bacterium]
MDVSQLPLDDVARRCAEETDKFRRKQSVDNRYCFELFRRALEERSQDAFTHIFRIYKPVCARWVRRVPGFEHSGEGTPDAFVSEAFVNFYKDLQGDRFRRFANLSAVLKYLKKCAVTAILQYIRKLRATELEVELGEDLPSEVEYDQLWTRICQLLPNDDDRLLADLRLRQTLKPAEIARTYPERWATARDVSVALQRILRTLRKDRELRAMAGISSDDEQLLGGL